MNNEEFIKGLDDLNIKYTNDMLNSLEKYLLLLTEYNKHTNLTRIIEREDAYLKHFYDSLTIVRVIDLNNVQSLLDIGSGAGFPGLVLKIFYPNLNITLLDSNNKKTKFLEYISKELKLDVTIINDRAENIFKDKINSYDVVTARAVANLRVLTEICIPFAKVDGYFIAMKGIVANELVEANTTINILNLTLEEKKEFNLPNDEGERSILKFKKNKESKLKDLRSYDKILKNPLK